MRDIAANRTSITARVEIFETLDQFRELLCVRTLDEQTLNPLERND